MEPTLHAVAGPDNSSPGADALVDAARVVCGVIA